MAKKNTTVKKKKVLKVEVVQPEVEQGISSFKKETIESEVILLPVDPTPEPVFNPNEPEMVGIEEGFKRPSITDRKPVHTKKQFKALIENWLGENESLKEKNPAKYQLKKSELETKLAKMKG